MSLTGKIHLCVAIKCRPNHNISFLHVKRSLTFTFLSLSELQKFVQATFEGLGQSVANGSHTGLVDVMSHLLAVRDRQAVTDKMFEPLRDTVILLEQYGVTIPDQVYTQLEVREGMCR